MNMPDNQDTPTAGFLGGQINPEDLKPKDEKKPASPPPAPAAGDGAGFLGAAASTPAPAASAPKPAQAAPESAASPAAADGSPGFMGAPASAPAPSPAPPAAPPPQPVPQSAAQSGPPPAPPEPAQPLPDVTASAAEFFTRAEELYDQGHLDSAITAYRRGLEKEPGNIVASNNLAMVYIDKERYEDACEELERALGRGAEDPELLSNLGYSLRKLGMDSQAADVYERYLAANPAAEDAEPIRAWISQVREAAPRSQAAPAETEAGPQPAAATFAVQPPEPQPPSPPAAPAPAAPALELEEPAVPSGTDAEADLIRKGDEAYAAEEYEQALGFYDQALTVNVDSGPALAGRGKTQAKLGLAEEGLASLREAVSINPNDAESYYVIGFLLRSMEQNSEAAEAYEKFLQLEPNDENADRIRSWIQEVRAASPEPNIAVQTEDQAETKDDGGLKIAKQPAWAQALEGPPPGAEDAVLPVTAAPAEPEPAAEPFAAQAQPAPAGEQEGNAGGMFAVAQPPAPEPQPEAAVEPESSGAGPVQAEPPAPGAGPAADEPADDVEQRLDEIAELLRNGDSAIALSKAQELVGQHLDCVEAKIMIARAFGQQGEFPKALAILQNVVAAAPHDEAYFFMGRCQQELGKSKEARVSLQKCVELTSNQQLKERAQTLLDEMGGGDRAVCASCTQTVPAADLQEVDGRKICTECRNKMEQAMGGQAAIAAATAAKGKLSGAATGTARPAKKHKAPARKKGNPLVIVLVLILLLPLGAAGVLAGLYFVKPGLYENIRTKLPSVIPLPEAPGTAPEVAINDDDTGSGPDDEGETAATEEETDEPEPRPTVTAGQELEIVSPAFTDAVVGVEYKHKVRIAGPKAKGAVLSVVFSRKLARGYGFDPKTGVLTWCPVPADLAAGPLTITFNAINDKIKAAPQTCNVRIRPPVRARRLGITAPVMPGEAVCLAAGDLTGDKRDDILLAYARTYWEGNLVLYKRSGQGFVKAGTLKLGGRPVGLGVGNFGDGRTRAMVVDYWNKRIALVGYEDGALVRLPGAVDDLPGRPTLAAFGNPDGEGPMGVAVYCPQQQQVFVFDAVGGSKLSLLRSIPAPAIDCVWQSMHMFDMDHAKDDPWHELALVRLGKGRPNVCVTSFKEGRKWMRCSVGESLDQVAVAGDVAGKMRHPRTDLALVTGGKDGTLHVLLGQPWGQALQAKPVSLGKSGILCSMLTADLDGSGTDDLVFLLANRIHYRIRSVQGMGLKLSTVNLPAGTYPPLGPAVSGEFTGDKSEDVIYVDRAGNLIVVAIGQE